MTTFDNEDRFQIDMEITQFSWPLSQEERLIHSISYHSAHTHTHSQIEPHTHHSD